MRFIVPTRCNASMLHMAPSFCGTRRGKRWVDSESFSDQTSWVHLTGIGGNIRRLSAGFRYPQFKEGTEKIRGRSYTPSRVTRTFSDSDLPRPSLHHAHFSSSFGASRWFSLLFAYFQCILGSRLAQFLMFATASRLKVFFDLPSPPLVTRDAIYERP